MRYVGSCNGRKIVQAAAKCIWCPLQTIKKIIAKIELLLVAVSCIMQNYDRKKISSFDARTFASAAIK
jgi:hypothetical protein